MMTEEEKKARRAEAERATVRAREVLKPGDRLLVTRCGGARGTVTMTGWEGPWITSKTRNDIHATHILKVNGCPTSFLDEPLPGGLRDAGFTSLDDAIDMANVGRSLLESIAVVTRDGPMKGWTPADDPAEIVTDLLNMLTDKTAWRDMDSAPRDGTMIELRVDYSGDEGAHPLEDDTVARTIGFNNLGNTEIDAWQIAGWCWSHDHFTEGKGRPIAWRPWSNA